MNKTNTISTRFRWAASDRYNLLKDFAKQNRRNSTLAEDILWKNIRNKQFGVEFRRQHIIADFIADFVCIDKMLIIEVDGGYHSGKEQIEEDGVRTEILNNLGFRVVRFTNEEVQFNLDYVITDNTKHIERMNTIVNNIILPSPRRGVGGEAIWY